MPSKRAGGKRPPPLLVGKCIYCGSTTPPLTREHVLPQGLGGKSAPEGSRNALVLQKASCEGCRRIIQRIEDDCLRNAMGHIRSRLGLRRKDRLRRTVTVDVTRKNGTTGLVEVSPHDIHTPFAIPIFREAGVLTN